MIDLLPDGDDEAIIDSVRAYLSGELPVERFRKQGWTAGDFGRWTEVAELGWFSGAGGEFGIDVAAETLIFRELGRTLFSPAALSTTLAVHLVGAEGARAGGGRDGLLADMMNGSQHVALAYGVRSPDRDYTLHIIDAAPDSLVLTGGKDSFALWEPSAFAQRKGLRSFDPTLSLSGTSLVPGAKPLAQSDDAGLLARAWLLTGAMAVGSAEATLALAVDYAKIRVAFGRPIGAFQAVAHHCANMAVRGEASLDQVLFGALCHREGMFDPAFQVAAATTVALGAAMDNAGTCIQVHGGMGFTFECEAHYHLKRAHTLKWLWGGPRAVREQLLAPAELYQTQT